MSNIIFMARLTDQGDFAAIRRAEQLLDQHGFSVGAMQRGSSRGILFGDYDIQKWRNLNVAERAALHGILDGERSSHAQIEIWDPAPLEAVAALADALEGEPHTVLTRRPPSFPKINRQDAQIIGERRFDRSELAGPPFLVDHGQGYAIDPALNLAVLPDDDLRERQLQTKNTQSEQPQSNPQLGAGTQQGVGS